MAGNAVQLGWKKKPNKPLVVAVGDQESDPIENDGYVHGSVAIETDDPDSDTFTWQVRNAGGTWRSCPDSANQSGGSNLADETITSQLVKVIPLEVFAFDEFRLNFSDPETAGITGNIQLFGGS